MAKEQLRAVLGANLRKFRNRREWSQLELSEKANISMHFLSEIERGNKWPSPENIQNLANALGVEAYELFRPENKGDPRMGKYMERFSRDVAIAVEESVKKSLVNVKRKWSLPR